MGKLILFLIFIALFATLILIGVNYWQKYLQEHKFEVKLADLDKERKLGLTEKYIKNVSLIDLNTSQPKVVVEFDEKGKKILETLLKKNREGKIVVEAEGKKLGEYSISTNVLEGKIILSGFVDAKEAKNIAEAISKEATSKEKKK